MNAAQASAFLGELPLKLALLQKEYARRAALEEEDRTVAALRLREAAELLCRGEVTLPGDAPEELFSPLRERYRAFLSPLLSACRTEGDAFALRQGLCNALADLLAPRELANRENFFAFEGGRRRDEDPGEKIAYLRNRFSDAAYDRVHAYLTKGDQGAPPPMAVYVESFSAGAEMLSEGRCTGLLFPCETEDGRPLPSVERLLEEYDLKKAAVCLLSPELGGASYALLRRTLRFPEESRYGEFRLPATPENERALFELPLFAAGEGLRTGRVETVLPGEGGEAFLRFLFRAPAPASGEREENAREIPEKRRKIPLLRMFFYLSMEYPGFTAGGFYPILPPPPSAGPAED